jgi:gas vesicle protein
MREDNRNPQDVTGVNMGHVLLGALAGAGIALLFAPAAGRQTRSWLGDRSRMLKDGAGDGVGAVKNAIETGADVVKESISAGKSAYARAADAVTTGTRNL